MEFSTLRCTFYIRSRNLILTDIDSIQHSGHLLHIEYWFNSYVRKVYQSLKYAYFFYNQKFLIKSPIIYVISNNQFFFIYKTYFFLYFPYYKKRYM